MEPLVIAGENAKWCTMENSLAVFKKLYRSQLYDPIIFLLQIHSGEM
jgi:hypothetical protein